MHIRGALRKNLVKHLRWSFMQKQLTTVLKKIKTKPQVLFVYVLYEYKIWCVIAGSSRMVKG